MHFTLLALAAMAFVASADNTVTFQSMDDCDRTVVWTGSSDIADTFVPAGETIAVSVPTGYTGNAYSYNVGEEDIPGMLAEFAFDSWASSTYFDVSAIVNPDDHNGVYQMWPFDSEWPVSGCTDFACPNAYYLPDDIQTKSTPSNHIVVALGGGPWSSLRSVPLLRTTHVPPSPTLTTSLQVLSQHASSRLSAGLAGTRRVLPVENFELQL